MKKGYVHSLLLCSILSISLTCKADKTGAELYQQCAGCHLKAAEGVPGMFPPLTDRLGALVKKSAGRDYLVMVINTGMVGNLKVDGTPYLNNMMPGQTLNNIDTAAVLNYLLEAFNVKTLPKEWSRFTESEIESIKTRYPNAKARDVYELRKSAFK